ncbi:hypothetical protein XELAEV_18005044mg [Xenopus laevis]|uniref:Uncharacterized protein n=1 Tax=Xenopus laevis TaxID=8355 RepID=A0A974I2A6_XENLA|nr:hypothetical protein XELAEV_18005044mg [Xenopus laevis]
MRKAGGRCRSLRHTPVTMGLYSSREVPPAALAELHPSVARQLSANMGKSYNMVLMGKQPRNAIFVYVLHAHLNNSPYWPQSFNRNTQNHQYLR